MGLLKKPADAKPLRTSSRGGSGAAVSALRPQQVIKLAPCIGTCPSGSDIRGWIAGTAQREKLGITPDQALEKAWRTLVDRNPFPATMGRVCPHPCEKDCSRVHKDGAVSINAMERFLGDWALEHKLAFEKIDPEPKQESVGVIGAGPAGLSFAYQLARRGYKVTVYEKTGKAGGMLYWGIPFYRLPAKELDAEIRRILDLGVELKLNTTIGKDVLVEELKKRHQALFLGIGAHRGKFMKVPGEEGPGVFTGTEYLYRVNNGEKVDVGKSVAVIGGGDTAVDAARAARRAGADVTILYRRTRVEMPAIESEIEDALKENIKLELLVAPVEVKRADGKVKAIVVQKMELGEPDESGRRRPVPIKGSEYEIPVDSIVAAISQEPDWGPLAALKPEKGVWLQTGADCGVADGVWAGGDVVGLGLATIAIGQGRQAAEVVDSVLRGKEPPQKAAFPTIPKERLKFEFYEAKPRAEKGHRPVEEWLKRPDDEIATGISADEFMQEISRCFSCGLCFGCERCWMYCTPSCFTKVAEKAPGDYYKIKLETCDGCKKCADECPCGFLDMV
ncbi:MAG: FAD-dependent oxidoreductase [Deltaproteobacteria bacterium]|nr:FAD-dependent oxidoreductase [Deltaproteobacteria bacterium]